MAEYDPDDNDEVGYGRPPKKHQFKKGQSGNPSGRPKGKKEGLAEIIEQVCKELITVKDENGRKRKIPKMEALMKQMMNQALRGDAKAALTLMRTLRLFPDVMEKVPPVLPPPIIQVNFVKAKDGRPDYDDGSEPSDPQDVSEKLQ